MGSIHTQAIGPRTGEATHHMSWFRTLTSREVASLFWILIVIILAFSFKSGRKMIWDLLKLVVPAKLSVAFLLSGLYVTSEAGFGRSLRIWKPELLQDTAIWWLVGAIPLMVTVTTAKTTKGLFRRIIRKSISLGLFVTFYINLYTLPILLEIVLQPFILILISIEFVASQKANFAQIRRLFSWVISLIGFAFGIYVCDQIIRHWPPTDLATRADDLILPIWLTLLYLPFLYLLKFYAVYDSIYSSIRFALKRKDKSLRYFLWIFSKFRFQLNLVNNLSPYWIREIYEQQTRQDRNRIIASFKESCFPAVTDLNLDYESDI